MTLLARLAALLCAAGFILLAAHHAPAQDRAQQQAKLSALFPRVEVVGESGEHMPGMNVVFRETNRQFTVEAIEGAADYRIDERKLQPWEWIRTGANWDVTISHEKFGMVTSSFTLTESPEPLKVTMKPGKQVSFRFETADGRDVPADMTVLVVKEEQLVAAWRAVDPISPGQQRLLTAASQEPGQYVAKLDEATSGVYLIVHKPGFLVGFRAGPFGADDLAQGVVDVKLPEPGRLKVNFEIEGDQATTASRTGYVTVQCLQTFAPGLGALFTLHSQEFEGSTHEAEFHDLAEGQYEVQAGRGIARDRNQFRKDKAGVVRETARVEVTAGEYASVALKSSPFSMDKFAGPYKARVKVTRFNGEPLAGESFALKTLEPAHGEFTVREGTIPEDGVILLEGLAAGITEPVRHGTSHQASSAKPIQYNLSVGGDQVRSLGFAVLTDELLHPLPENEILEVEVTLPPGVGDQAPDITLTSISSAEQLKLSSLKGQVVYLDFWATWCGPCQEPMEKLNLLAESRKDDWNGKVAIVCASIDSKADTVVSHTQLKGWASVQHYWCPDEEGHGGLQSPQPKLYGVTAVPTALLIDQEGIIVWRGHPGKFDKQAGISRLLK